MNHLVTLSSLPLIHSVNNILHCSNIVDSRLRVCKNMQGVWCSITFDGWTKLPICVVQTPLCYLDCKHDVNNSIISWWSVHRSAMWWIMCNCASTSLKLVDVHWYTGSCTAVCLDGWTILSVSALLLTLSTQHMALSTQANDKMFIYTICVN